MTAPEVLNLCRARGVKLIATDGKLKFSGLSTSVDNRLKELLACHKNDLLVLVSDSLTESTPEVWDITVALALMYDTDSLVERLGVSGTDPEIQAAAAAFGSAHNRRDMAGVRAACCQISERAKQLARSRKPS